MWPGGVAMESLSNMDSAGSCDSVISMNSGYSEDSMEHLSAEERACLMYLEETIEALEVQEDSGLSNDEPDPGLQVEKLGRTEVNDISNFKSDEFGRAEHDVQNPTPEPQSSPVSAADTKDLTSSSQNLMTQPQPPVAESVSGCEIPTSATQNKLPCLPTDGDGNPKIATSAGLCPGQTTEASEMDLGLIPPPSDFMDEPRPAAHPERLKDLPPSAATSGYSLGAPIKLEQLRQRASAKKALVGPSMTQETPKAPPPEVSHRLSPPDVTSASHQISPPPEAAEPRSPPAVAPKPKKLPANIILKSHKAVVSGSDGNSGHPAPTGSERALLDPQRVRMEALRKLGLLRSEEADSGPALSPKLSPKTRRSWGAPPSPISPAAPHTPPLTPSHARLSGPPPALVPPRSPAAASPPANPAAPDLLPAPAAFSDQVGPLPSDSDLSAAKDVSEAKVSAQVNTPPPTPPQLTKQFTPPKNTGVKSATLERSGLGLSKYMAGHDSSEAGQGVSDSQSLSQLRNSRPRPASLGSRKEFSGAPGEGLQAGRAASQEAVPRKSLHAQAASQHSGDTQKLPRSQGISVLICPRAENGENRREALKKLGLLRD